MWYPSPILQYFDDNGNPLVGGKLYTYINQTTTPKTTYSDYDLVTPNTNPIILDARGECGPVYGFGYFKFVLKDENDVTIWTADNIWGIGCCSIKETFVDADLDGSGDVTITHSYNMSHLRVTVYNGSNKITIPDYVDGSSASQIVIGFGDRTITGTYTVRYGP